MSERPRIAGGYLIIARRMFRTDPLWLEEREFSRSEAWLDLLQLAPWRRTSIQVRGAILELDRGEFLGGRGFLAGRWRWSEKRVRTFLELLIEDERIAVSRSSPRGTIYRISNYDAFQGAGAKAGSRAGSGPGEGPGEGAESTGDARGEGRREGRERAGSRAAPRPQEKASNPRKHSTRSRRRREDVEILDGLREGIERLIARGVGDLEAPFRRRAAEATSSEELILLGDDIEQALDRLEAGQAPALRLVEGDHGGTS